MMKLLRFKLAMIMIIGAGFAYAQSFSTKSVGQQQITSDAAIFNNALSNLSNGTLSNNDIDGLGLNFDDCGGLPLDNYMLDYLETFLTDGAANTDTWQSDIDAQTDCDEDGADWILTNMIDNSSNYPASNLTATMIDNLLEMDGYTDAVLGAADLEISDLQDNFDNSSLTTPVLDASVAALVWQTVGGYDSADQAESSGKTVTAAITPRPIFRIATTVQTTIRAVRVNVPLRHRMEFHLNGCRCDQWR